MGHCRRVPTLAATAIAVAAAGILAVPGSPLSNPDAGQVASASSASVEVKSLVIFGPAPLTMGDRTGRYGWMIGEIESTIGQSQAVTLSLSVSDPPFGCDQNVQLILPGPNPFTLLPYEAKWVLFRARYECGVCGDPGLSGVDISLCASGASGSSCQGRCRAFLIDEPVTQKRYVGSPTSTAWFTFCEPLQGCLLWPASGWYYFSQHRVAFLDGNCYGVPMQTTYLQWFAHGEYIYDQRDDSRPFDVYPLAWGTTTSLGLENLTDYTTAMSCEQWYHPPEDGLYCSSGQVGHTYVRPTTFDGWARLQCHGPLGSDCLGLPLIEYTWTYE